MLAFERAGRTAGLLALFEALQRNCLLNPHHRLLPSESWGWEGMVTAQAKVPAGRGTAPTPKPTPIKTP